MASRITSSWVIPLAACFCLLLAAQPSGSIERSLSNSLGDRFSEVRMFSTICSTIAISGCLWGFLVFRRSCVEMFTRRRMSSKWPLKRGRAPYIALGRREGGPSGSHGRQGTSGARESRKVPGGEFCGLSQDQLLPPSHHSPSNYVKRAHTMVSG